MDTNASRRSPFVILNASCNRCGTDLSDVGHARYLGGIDAFVCGRCLDA